MKTYTFVKYFKSENNQLIMCQQIFFLHLHLPALITNMLIVVFILVFYICSMRSGVQNRNSMLHKEIYFGFLIFVNLFYATMDTSILSAFLGFFSPY